MDAKKSTLLKPVSKGAQESTRIQYERRELKADEVSIMLTLMEDIRRVGH